MMNAVLRFHLHVGIRLALRIFVPVFSIFFALYYLLRPELFNSLMAHILSAGLPLCGIIITAIVLMIAVFFSRRVCLGTCGWIRHLPVESTVHRRMAGLAVAISLLPVLAIFSGLAIISIKLYQVSAAPFLTGLPLAGLACGQFVLPVKKKSITRLLAALASVSFSSNNWAFLAGGILFLAAADWQAGPLVKKRKHAKSRKPIRSLTLVAAINWRALRMRPLALYLVCLPFLGASRLFISNNNPAPALAESIVRLGGGLSLTLFCSLFASMMASRRPPWPWIRSLPWSSRSKVLWDFSFIASQTMPIIILVGIMNLRSMLLLLLSLPLIAAYSAFAIRQAPVSMMGAWGKILLYGTFGSLLFCLLPWSSVCFLALTPLGLYSGTKAEKHQKVSRWLELHHLAAGDSLSWSE